jgi:hypothetical protein
MHNAEQLHEAGVAFLSSNDFRLGPRNLGVPLGGSFPLLDFALRGAPMENVRQNLLASLEECERSKKRFALISAENALGTAPNLSDRLPEFFEQAIKRFDIRLIAYVRRPDEWLTSAWKQWGMKVGDLSEWFVRACLKPEPSFGAGLEAWQQALGAREKIYCNILSSVCLFGGNIISDFLKHSLGDLAIELKETPNANVSPPAAWINLLFESKATLFSNEDDISFGQFLETLIAKDDGRERNVDEILTAEGRTRITRIFRHDIERLIEGFIPDKIEARRYFGLDLCPSGSEMASPYAVPEMTEYLRGAFLPQGKAAIEQAFRAVVLGAMRGFDKRLSTIVDLMEKQAEVYESKLSELRSVANEAAEAVQLLRRDIEQHRTLTASLRSEVKSAIDAIVALQAGVLVRPDPAHRVPLDQQSLDEP